MRVTITAHRPGGKSIREVDVPESDQTSAVRAALLWVLEHNPRVLDEATKLTWKVA